MKVTFTKPVFINDGRINHNKDTYDPKGIRVPSTEDGVPVTINFRHEVTIGKSQLFLEDEKVIGDFNVEVLEIPEITGMFPAIKANIIKIDGKKILEWEIIEIGLCTKPNTDSRIQPVVTPDIKVISEQ